MQIMKLRTILAAVDRKCCVSAARIESLRLGTSASLSRRTMKLCSVTEAPVGAWGLAFSLEPSV
jgi:hypothetical protein